MNRILIAGIGNILGGDDAFAAEVMRRLAQRTWPECVDMVDFGNRASDLTYALSQDYQSVILVDSMVPRGRVPGTIYLIRRGAGEREAEAGVRSAAGSDSILRLAKSTGGPTRRVMLVGLEPLLMESGGDEGVRSKAISDAIAQAAAMVEALAEESMGAPQSTQPGRGIGAGPYAVGSPSNSVPPPTG